MSAPAADRPDFAWPPCPFWDWACVAYRRPGVAEACLELQDRGGHDVILVLFALWLGQRGIVLDDALAEAARRATSAYQQQVVHPLRAVRRALKERLAAADEAGPEDRHPRLAAALRNRIKALELDAERLELLTLAALVAGRDADASPTCALALANLERLLPLSEDDRRTAGRLQAHFAT